MRTSKSNIGYCITASNNREVHAPSHRRLYQRYRPFAAIGLDGGLPPPSCRSYSAHKESPAEAGQGLSWKENQDEETGTDTQIAAVLRLGSQGSAPRTHPVAGSRPRRAWDG
jgi:hypothetical protein